MTEFHGPAGQPPDQSRDAAENPDEPYGKHAAAPADGQPPSSGQTSRSELMALVAPYYQRDGQRGNETDTGTSPFGEYQAAAARASGVVSELEAATANQEAAAAAYAEASSSDRALFMQATAPADTELGRADAAALREGTYRLADAILDRHNDGRRAMEAAAAERAETVNRLKAAATAASTSYHDYVLRTGGDG